MARRGFIRRSYLRKYGAQNDLITRDEIQNLEDRISDWSQGFSRPRNIDTGISIPGVKLIAVPTFELVAAAYTGRAEWEVTSNANINGTTITAQTTAGTMRKKVGTDFALGSDAELTAIAIQGAFSDCPGLACVQTAETVEFRCLPGFAPVGALISTDDAATPGFVNQLTVPWEMNSLFTKQSDADLFQVGESYRLASGGLRTNLLPDIITVTIVTQTQQVTFDRIPPVMEGGESYYKESVNKVSIPSIAKGPSNWVVTRQSDPGAVWQAGTGDSKILTLKVERDMTVDLWVW